MDCPNCGYEAYRDSVDVGVGIMYGPWGCPCGWSESSDFNLLDSPVKIDGYIVDPFGGATPRLDKNSSVE